MSNVELVLKSPTDRVAPFTINCDNFWTIIDLKSHINILYPNKPEIKTQKLIYLGKLLKDEQIIKDIFGTDNRATVHLICQPSINILTADKKESAPNSNYELYREYQNYLNNFYSSTVESPCASGQYQHTEAVRSNYRDQWNQQANDNGTNTSFANNDSTNMNQENHTDNERHIEPAIDNGVPNVMAAAAAIGRLMDDDDENENEGDAEPRDLLHYSYILIRFGLLFIMCYSYSSMFSVVTTLMIFFLFFGVNFFRRHINIRQNIPTEHVAENVFPQPMTAAENVTDSNVQIDNQLEIDRLSGISDYLRRVAALSFQFVFTFFTSLFPDPVDHLIVN